MKKLILIFIVCLIGSSSPAWAQFVNGSFESGDTTGWTLGGGYRANIYNNTYTPILNPTDFLPGGGYYNTSTGGYPRSAIVTQGVAPHTDGTLNQVYGGSYAFRAENLVNGGYASVITQRVNNYTDPNIFFAWAAVLEGAHSNYDAATFKLVLRNETAGTDLITREYNAASGGGGVDARFTLSSDNFYYTPWETEQLALGGAVGNDFSLTLLAADCEQTGHMGMVYLDGFGAAPPQPGAVPEPATMLLLGSGLIGLAGYARKRFKK
jgi:hypothetical protein